MSEPKEIEYFAVPDPDDAGRMTYWRSGPRGLTAWPPHARYGPVLLKRDVPKGLGAERGAWIHAWFVEHRHAWFDRVVAAIDADRDAAAARFAVFTFRCCCCSRLLSDPASKSYAVGPDCRSGFPPQVLAVLAEKVGRFHAEQLAAGGVPEGQGDLLAELGGVA